MVSVLSVFLRVKRGLSDRVVGPAIGY